MYAECKGAACRCRCMTSKRCHDISPVRKSMAKILPSLITIINFLGLSLYIIKVLISQSIYVYPNEKLVGTGKRALHDNNCTIISKIISLSIESINLNSIIKRCSSFGQGRIDYLYLEDARQTLFTAPVNLVIVYIVYYLYSTHCKVRTHIVRTHIVISMHHWNIFY